MGKGYITKHTAKELETKAKLATQNAGGGKSGLEDRKGGKAGHSRFQCPLCKQVASGPIAMQQHYDSKHPKETLDPSKLIDLHAIHGGTTQGVAVHGSLKAAKNPNAKSSSS